jgi:hypothetical protein
MRVADVAGALDWLECPAVRAPQHHRPDRPQPWRLDDDARGAGKLRPGQRGLRGGGRLLSRLPPRSIRDVAVPLLILIGDKDDWTPAENCRRLQAGRLHAARARRGCHYPSAYHSFDAAVPIAPSPWPTARAIGWATIRGRPRCRGAHAGLLRQTT